MQVRVRRDANEQLVLAHVYNRLSNLVSTLTIQIFKDDWTRASTYSFMGSNPAFPSNYNYTGPSLLPGRVPSPTQDFSMASPASSYKQSVQGHMDWTAQGHQSSDQGHGHSHSQDHGHSHGSGGYKSHW